jgi:hypothetical protein
MTEDPGTGKPCPLCAAPMVGIGTYYERHCVDCHTTHSWPRDEDQAPLVTTNRDTRGVKQ